MFFFLLYLTKYTFCLIFFKCFYIHDFYLSRKMQTGTLVIFYALWAITVTCNSQIFIQFYLQDTYPISAKLTSQVKWALLVFVQRCWYGLMEQQ